MYVCTELIQEFCVFAEGYVFLEGDQYIIGDVNNITSVIITYNIYEDIMNKLYVTGVSQGVLVS